MYLDFSWTTRRYRRLPRDFRTTGGALRDQVRALLLQLGNGGAEHVALRQGLPEPRAERPWGWKAGLQSKTSASIRQKYISTSVNTLAQC